MSIQLFFAILSSIIGIACFAPYIRDIFKHTTEPHPYSWLIWTILQTTAVVVMISDGAGMGVASLAIGAVLCGTIFLLSLRYGTANIKLFDVICLIGALIATAIYLFLQNALLSIIIISLIDFIAFLPTFRKAYEEPRSETASTFALSSISSILALFALSNFTLTTTLYLITLVITNATCVLIILIRRK